MRKTLHISWHIILLHQIIPHGAGLTDILADLHQFAHHLRVHKKGRWCMGVGFRRICEEQKEKDVRKGELASVATAQIGLNKGRKGVGHKTHWAPRVAYL